MNDEVKLTSGDQALLDVASGKAPGVRVTSEMLNGFKAALDERQKEVDEDYPRLIASCPEDVRLAITAQVFKAIVDHAKEPGSFRYLIYERLGFDTEAYVPLYWAGGMTISNEFNLTRRSSMELVREFHDAFNVPSLAQPSIPDQERCELRVGLLGEELQELQIAIENRDRVGILDA